ALPGLVAVGLPAADVCGAGSQLAGTSVLALTGGSLAPGASCAFTVTLQVPGTAASVSYPGPTSPVTATAGGVAVMGPSATDTLEVADLELLKVFDGAAAPGDDVLLSFSLSNPDPVNAATALTFSDDLDA